LKKLIALTATDLLQPASFKKYLAAFGIIAVVCYFNYYGGISLWLKHEPFLFSLSWYSILFAVFFAAGIIIEAGTGFFNHKSVQLLLIVAPVLFALKIAIPFRLLLPFAEGSAYQNTFQQPATWLGGLILFIGVLLLLHRFTEKQNGLYGTAKTVSLQTYFLLVFLMLPLLIWASLQTDFAAVYPKAQIISTELGTEAKPLHYVLFETAYASDFFSIELFFRGFLIITLGKIMGRQCILPIALFYFSIHLGKPMLEAISSFFGGLILGAISYNSKSIWGGLLVHVSIALLMELFGFLF
jgi:membrane protease YdiL (CAAX protease family)